MQQSRITFHLDPLVHAELEEFVAKRKAEKLRSGLGTSNTEGKASTLGKIIEEAIVFYLKTEKKKGKK